MAYQLKLNDAICKIDVMWHDQTVEEADAHYLRGRLSFEVVFTNKEVEEWLSKRGACHNTYVSSFNELGNPELNGIITFDDELDALEFKLTWL